MADMGKKKGQAKANLSQCDDPWFLPQYYYLRKNDKYWKSLRTDSGYWKEKEEELTAIRSAGESESSCSDSPSYVGVRKTLEFYLRDGTNGGEGTKTEWIMHEYNHLRKDDAGQDLILQEDVVLRKVFQKSKNTTDQQSSLYRQVESCLEAHRSHRGIVLGTDKVAQCQDRSSSSLTRPFHIIGQLPGFAFLGKALPDGAVRAELRSRLFSKITPTPLETPMILRSPSKESLVLVLDRVHSLARSLQNRMIRSSSDHTYQTQISSLLTTIEQKIKCWMHSLSASPNQDLGVDCDPDALNYLLTEIEQEINCSMHSVRVRAPNEDLGVDCDPDGKSDSVWKHFTKIRSANNGSDEVYAACHRCDKVYKAHPKKHGISHLKRHVLTCTSCTNPSTDEDREMLHRLRTALDDPDDQQKMYSQVDLITQLDPLDLSRTHPTWYVTRSLNRETQVGHWKEINKEFTAIRMDQLQGCWKGIDKEIAAIQMDHQLQVKVSQPQYMGLRRTLQFHRQDGRKMDWIMFEYQQLDDIKSPALLLQGHMVIRKVFRYDKDEVASAFSELVRKLNRDDDDDEGRFNGAASALISDFDSRLNGDDDHEEYFNGAASAFSDLDTWLNGDDEHEEYLNGEGVSTDTSTRSDYMDTPCFVFPLGEGMNTDNTTPSSDYMDTPVDRKRKRTSAASGRKSKVWMHFTKIRSTDCGLLYVVCHICDRGYTSGSSKNGTNHLWRHNKSCTNKGPRTENVTEGTTKWEAEIWPEFLLFKTYGETEHQSSGKY